MALLEKENDISSSNGNHIAQNTNSNNDNEDGELGITFRKTSTNKMKNLLHQRIYGIGFRDNYFLNRMSTLDALAMMGDTTAVCWFIANPNILHKQDTDWSKPLAYAAVGEYGATIAMCITARLAALAVITNASALRVARVIEKTISSGKKDVSEIDVLKQLSYDNKELDVWTTYQQLVVHVKKHLPEKVPSLQELTFGVSQLVMHDK